jgi:hypothetical protein
MKNLTNAIVFVTGFAIYTAIVWLTLYLISTLLFGASFNVTTWGVGGREFLGAVSMLAGFTVILCESVTPMK